MASIIRAIGVRSSEKIERAVKLILLITGVELFLLAKRENMPNDIIGPIAIVVYNRQTIRAKAFLNLRDAMISS